METLVTMFIGDRCHISAVMNSQGNVFARLGNKWYSNRFGKLWRTRVLKEVWITAL